MQKFIPKYKRVLLKLSGEALSGSNNFGIDSSLLSNICNSIISIKEIGVEVGIVIGGGNLFRGEELSKEGFNRVTCDQIGILATIMNGLILRDFFLSSYKIDLKVFSPILVPGIVDIYDRTKAIEELANGSIVVFVSGTGCPLFSTDSAAGLRAIETDCDILLKATKVNGVYSSDPEIDKSAKFFKNLKYNDVLNKNLKVMDDSSIVLSREHKMPIRIFNMNEKDALLKIVNGGDIGTLIS